MLVRVALIVGLLALTSLAYWWWQRRDGAVRAVEHEGSLSSDVLGAQRGYHATFVQFSTPMCSKCPGTALLLKTVAEEHKHVAHIEIDASERLDLAREHQVMRTPTVLVLDSNGVPVARMDGAPTVEQARDALARVPSSPTDYSI